MVFIHHRHIYHQLVLLSCVWTTGFSIVNPFVCLKYNIRSCVLHLSCTVSELTFDVTISNSFRNVSGTCKAPNHPNNLIECSTNVRQNLTTNTTEFTIELSENTVADGMWICEHGTRRGSDNVFVSGANCRNDSFPRLIEDKEISKYLHEPQEKTECTIQNVFLGVLAFVFLLSVSFIIWRNRRKKKQKDITKEIKDSSNDLLLENKINDGNEERGNPDNSQTVKRQGENLHMSDCVTCKHMTAFAYCNNCEGFLCEACYSHHGEINSDHVMNQVEHTKDAQSSVLCKTCGKDAKKVCTKCAKSYCNKCKCENEHDDFLKKFIIERDKECQNCKEIRTDKHFKFQQKIKFENDTLPTSVCGLSFLSKGRFLIVDSHNRKLKIFENNEFKTHVDVPNEPRGMAAMGDDEVALTFPHEKEIRKFGLKDPNQNPNPSVITMKHKPFSIAYDKEYFAVECGEREDGYIAILDRNGNLKFCLNEAQECGYFTGHTMRLELDATNEHVFISAMSKKTVTCLGFDGQIKWKVQIPSPRGLMFSSQLPSKFRLLAASRHGNAIYCINQETHNKEVVISGLNIAKPRYITYNPYDGVMYVSVLGLDDKDQIAVYSFKEIDK